MFAVAADYTWGRLCVREGDFYHKGWRKMLCIGKTRDKCYFYDGRATIWEYHKEHASWYCYDDVRNNVLLLHLYGMWRYRKDWVYAWTRARIYINDLSPANIVKWNFSQKDCFTSEVQEVYTALRPYFYMNISSSEMKK